MCAPAIFSNRGWKVLCSRACSTIAVCAIAVSLGRLAFAEDSAESTELEFGLSAKSEGGDVRSLIGTVTVPADWPDQQRVRIVRKDLPPGAAISFKNIEDVGRQMVVRIPHLTAGETVRAVVTFGVERLAEPPAPTETDRFKAATKADNRKLGIFMSPSPKIESNDPTVRKAAEEAVAGHPGVWDKVVAIHEWVHKKIKFTGDLENVQTCIQTLEIRSGVCAELNSLDIAMLRAAGFPARLVRVPGHCYYEVYLLDGEKHGHWFAGDASALPTIELGKTPGGVILQKGDNVTIVDPATRRSSKGRVLAETFTGTPLSKGVQVEFHPITPALKAQPTDKPKHPKSPGLPD